MDGGADQRRHLRVEGGAGCGAALGTLGPHPLLVEPLRSTAVQQMHREQVLGGILVKSDFFSFSVQTSREPGWLEGTLNGKRGLIPQNYVKLL